MKIIRVGSQTKWEDQVGYSRIVIANQLVEIAGTTAVDESGNLVGADDAYLQTRYIIQKIERILLTLGLSLKHVIRTRIYVTDIDEWESIGRAHGDFFKEIKPATSMIEISKLIDPKMKVEIEMSAINESNVSNEFKSAN